MSAEELRFRDEINEGQHLTFKFKNNIMYLHTCNDDPSPMEFNRSEAHLLMLWLQEHLKEPSGFADNFKDYWLCSCGRHHPKDFVCERINK